MGMIKIPSNAIKHFEKHYPSIFESSIGIIVEDVP